MNYNLDFAVWEKAEIQTFNKFHLLDATGVDGVVGGAYTKSGDLRFKACDI